MIITQNSAANPSPNARELIVSHIEFHWIGFIYLPGVIAGEKTIVQLAARLQQMPIEQAVIDLKGHYFLAIIDPGNKKTYAMIDHSGMFQAYYSSDCISTSFLELAKREHLDAADLNKEKVVEFIQLGNIFENRTFFDAINGIAYNEILSFDADGQIKKNPKNLLPLTDIDPEFSFISYFEELCESLEEQSISADITGGIDSRLIVAMLDHFSLHYELAISGEKKHPDVIIARKIADSLNHDLLWTPHDLSSLEQAIPLLFKICDGLYDPLKYHRLSIHQQKRKSRGAGVLLSGMGGELYKDFWWLQDLPFYNKKEPDISRLFYSRIWPTKCPHTLFGAEYHELSQNLPQRLIGDLSKYQTNRNTTTYDLIYYYFKMQAFGARMITNNNCFFPHYAPLLERDVVRFGINLKRTDRFFNQFHRKIMTDIHPQLAKIDTTEGGMSVSSERMRIFRDSLLYGYDKSLRLTKKIGQKVLNKTYLQPVVDNAELYLALRKLPLTLHYIDIAKDIGVIQKDVHVDQIQNNHIGSFIAIGMLTEHLG